MTKTTAPTKTPSPAEQAKPHTAVGQKTSSPSSVFIGAVLDMSWRLTIVVLVPIVGGYELDQRLDTEPLLTILGFILAGFGMVLVLWQMIKAVNKLPVPKQDQRS